MTPRNCKISHRLVHRFSQKDQEECFFYFGLNTPNGLPYYGPDTPALTTEECLARLHLINLARAQMFDLTDPAQLEEYQLVLEGVFCGWFLIYYHERIFDNGQRLTWVEWSIPCWTDLRLRFKQQ